MPAVDQDYCFPQPCLFPLRLHETVNAWDMHVAVSRPAEVAGSANSLNFRLIYTTTSSCMSHRYIKCTVKTEAHVPRLPPNQLLYFISPSQHHHSSSCSNQKHIHPGLLPLLIFIQSSILSPTCLLYIYTLLFKPRPQSITAFLHIFLQSNLHVTVSVTLLQQI